MQNNENKAVISPEFIIEDLLNQNKELAKQRAFQVAICRQLQAESEQLLSIATNKENENKELKEKIEALEAKFEDLNSKASEQKEKQDAAIE